MRLPRSREPASATDCQWRQRRVTSSTPDEQQGTEIPAGAKDTMGRRRSLDLEGSIAALTPKLFSLIPWQSIVAIYLSLAGGADSSYFAC